MPCVDFRILFMTSIDGRNRGKRIAAQLASLRLALQQWVPTSKTGSIAAFRPSFPCQAYTVCARAWLQYAQRFEDHVLRCVWFAIGSRLIGFEKAFGKYRPSNR